MAELIRSNWLNMDEIKAIRDTVHLLGEGELTEELDEFLDISGHKEGAYIMNLHGVNINKLIRISKNYNLIDFDPSKHGW